MTTKKITDLTQTTELTGDDLFLVRKTAEGFDKSITKENLVETIGNPAVTGFTAVYDDVNRLTLHPANGAEITEYKANMVISFIVPAGTYNSDSNTEVKIDDLDYKVVNVYGDDDNSVTLYAGQYVEAVYSFNSFHHTNDTNEQSGSIEYTVGGTANAITLTSKTETNKDAYYDGLTISFIAKYDGTADITINIDGLGAKALVNQIGANLNTSLRDGQPVFAIYKATSNSFVTNVALNNIVTNEYNVASTDVDLVNNITTFNLTSATGLPKEIAFGDYYNGMTATFTAKFDDEVRIRSKGAVYIKLDGLGAKLLRDQDNDAVQNDVLLDQTIIAKYNGTDFIKNRFAVEADEGIIEPLPLPLINPVVDPYNPDYAGDPRDPANTLNENAVDDQGNKIFNKIYNVGASLCTFKTISEAMSSITREFGNSGERLSGKKIALVIKSNFIQNDMKDSWYDGTGDLRFITIFSENNLPITINPGWTFYNAQYTPIFNLKMIKNSNTTSGYSIIRTDRGHITLGKNTELTHIQITNEVSGVLCIGTGLTSKYGCTITSKSPLFYTGSNKSNVTINKLNFIYTGTTPTLTFGRIPSIFNLEGDGLVGSLSNIIITITNKQDNEDYGVFRINGIHSIASATLINITCTDRSGRMFGVKAYNTNLTLTNCNFAAGGTTSGGLGYDIQVIGQTRANTITIDANTVGYGAKLNQAINVETTNGRILLAV